MWSLLIPCSKFLIPRETITPLYNCISKGISQRIQTILQIPCEKPTRSNKWVRMGHLTRHWNHTLDSSWDADTVYNWVRMEHLTRDWNHTFGSSWDADTVSQLGTYGTSHEGLKSYSRFLVRCRHGLTIGYVWGISRGIDTILKIPREKPTRSNNWVRMEHLTRDSNHTSDSSWDADTALQLSVIRGSHEGIKPYFRFLVRSRHRFTIECD